jgi:glycosyltransferase involved in cell wall biosynthesis
MKILLVTPSYFPIIGGSEVLTRNLSRKLQQKGLHVDIMTLNMNEKWNPRWKEETIKEGSINVFRVAAVNPLPNLPNPLFNLFRINVLPKPNFLSKLKGYDVVHFIGEADLSLPILSYFIKKPKIMQCVGIYGHGGIYHYYRFKRPYLGNIFAKFFPHLADIYIVYPYEHMELLSELGVPFNKIVVLPIGIDINNFQGNKKEKINNLILFVGRIYRIKGLHILLNALNYIKTPTQLAIIGPIWDEKYYKEIEQIAKNINEKGVHSIKLLGPMDHENLTYWYRKAAILVTPYLYETYSYTTLEALACETPVVSTGTHILNDVEDGILVVSKDPRKMAQVIEELLKNKRLREKYGQSGRRLIERYFSWELIVDQLKKIYLDLITNKTVKYDYRSHIQFRKTSQ